jgi:hypothetical protein
MEVRLGVHGRWKHLERPWEKDEENNPAVWDIHEDGRGVERLGCDLLRGEWCGNSHLLSVYHV